jgi:hypothetical protein
MVPVGKYLFHKLGKGTMLLRARHLTMATEFESREETYILC